MLIPVAFLVTALIRTAQGSATVAMITAGGMVAPIAIGADLSYSALYLALAIGCGSKPISWANDSGFWVIGRMTGMTPMETFKTVSVMMMIMSLAGLAVVLLGAIFIPLV
jgi:GntP family gluconate:H+ symporter